QDVCCSLVGDLLVADADHVESTQPAALRQVGRTPAQTRTEWREATQRTLEIVQRSGDLDRDIALHGMRPTLAVLLVIRAFELWTHENDVRQATELPLSVPDASTLRLMTALAARLVPFSADRAGQHERVDLHLVLTGPGGGTWDLEVGDDASEPVAISIITDAAGFCRLAANR